MKQLSDNSMSSMLAIHVLILSLSLYSVDSSLPIEKVSISDPVLIGSRSILRSLNEKSDYAVDLNATNFDSVLKETPATFAVVEFFANWCPACRNYKAQYEKVAKLFNGPDAVHPGIVLMTRVDCALKINNEICNKFSVTYYPMLLWGPPSKFLSGGWDPKQKNSGLHSIDDGRTADRLVNWINKRLNSSYGLDDEKYENEHLQTNVSDPGQIARAIYDVEEATSTAFDIILQHKMIKPETRASLMKFFQLLVVHHPSRRCRKGTSEILVDFDVFSANKKETGSVDEKSVLGKYHICGKNLPRGYWIFCRGSKNGTRDFSCGLWVLLHSLSVRVEDGESQMAFTVTCDFIHDFFICEECRQHFYEMCSSVSKPFKEARDFVLWLWNAHNKVNERLMKEEDLNETADPKFPKIIWPSRQLCPSCYLNESSKDKFKGHINWNHDEVYRFLFDYYGKTLISLYKDKEVLVEKQGVALVSEDLGGSTHAVVVPVGAALAIAVASCAFGALACFWRQQQKSRKPTRRSWN